MNETTLFSLVVMIVIFLICREIMCWYWKMNEIVKILNKILLTLDPMANQTPMNYKEYKKDGK